jgi:hypothetical protein
MRTGLVVAAVIGLAVLAEHVRQRQREPVVHLNVTTTLNIRTTLNVSM